MNAAMKNRLDRSVVGLIRMSTSRNMGTYTLEDVNRLHGSMTMVAL